VLEPGGMATDWAGSSMQVPPVSEPYQATVGAMARVHDDLGSSAALGDPAKVAQVVLAVAGMDEPPLRLILGSEAYAYATAAPGRGPSPTPPGTISRSPPTATARPTRSAIRSPPAA